MKKSRSDVCAAPMPLEQRIARIALGALLPATLATMAPTSVAQTSSWAVNCSALLAQAGFQQCAGGHFDGSRWHDSSPTGSFGSGGHDRVHLPPEGGSSRSQNSYAGQSTVGLLSGTVQHSSGIFGLNNSLDAVGRGETSWIGRFTDLITLRSESASLSGPIAVRLSLGFDSSAQSSVVGTLGSGAKALAYSELQLEVNRGDVLRDCTWSVTGSPSGCPIGVGDLTASTTVYLNLNQGYMFELILSLGAHANALGPAPASRWSGSSSAWASAAGGFFIESLDPRARVEAASGFNYSPVPEPGAWALLIAGIGIVMARSSLARKLG